MYTVCRLLMKTVVEEEEDAVKIEEEKPRSKQGSCVSLNRVSAGTMTDLRAIGGGGGVDVGVGGGECVCASCFYCEGIFRDFWCTRGKGLGNLFNLLMFGVDMYLNRPCPFSVVSYLEIHHIAQKQ